MKRDYELRLDRLEKLYQVGKKISITDLGVTGTTLRTYQLEAIVEKILLHDCSIVHLVKGSSDSDYKVLDISAIASIARNVMECINLYFYIAERKIKNDEISLRYTFSSLNYYRNITDILAKLDFSKDCFCMRAIKFGKENAIAEIKSSEFYKKSDKNIQNRLLSGAKPLYKAPDANILEKKHESAIYNILSNSSHSLFIGLGSNSFSSSPIYQNHISPLMMLAISTEICIIYTAHMLCDYLLLRKKLNTYLTDEEKKLIKEMKNMDYLHQIIETEKAIFSTL